MNAQPKWCYLLLCLLTSAFYTQGQSHHNESVHIQTEALDKQMAAMDSTEPIIEAPNSVFVVVDQAPHFPGGSDKMLDYIIENTNLPVETDVPVGGKILVQFIVEKDGSLTDIKVIKGIKSSYDEECRRVFASMPKWKPGKKGSHDVRTLYMVPLRFS